MLILRVLRMKELAGRKTKRSASSEKWHRQRALREGQMQKGRARKLPEAFDRFSHEMICYDLAYLSESAAVWRLCAIYQRKSEAFTCD
jgi:hypothetical protein